MTETETQIAKLDKAILATHRNNDVSIRLATVPGTGSIIATCLSASVPDAKLFKGGRELAAWLGLVPGQHSGGKPRLGTISRMGNRHLCKILEVGAHAALYWMRKGPASRKDVKPSRQPLGGQNMRLDQRMDGLERAAAQTPTRSARVDRLRSIPSRV